MRAGLRAGERAVGGAGRGRSGAGLEAGLAGPLAGPAGLARSAGLNTFFYYLFNKTILTENKYKPK